MISDIGLVSTLVLPTLMQDITDKADKWGNDGKSGRIDPFTEIYDVSFLLHNLWDRCRFVPFSSFSS
jgi:hypothetical protein